MKRAIRFVVGISGIIVLLVSPAFGQKEFAQRILLDKITTVGTLKAFPGFEGNKNDYYYLPNKLRLATQDDGSPAFSFLWWVQNVRSGADDKEISEGEGGAYVHLLIELKVTPEELQEANQELRRVNPAGKLLGPVIYTGGTMELICALINDENKKQVLGIGPAPTIEGDKIAVSFILDKKGAKLLYENLKSATPQISFNLNMTMRGYQSPVEFKIEIEWDKVYKHKNFNAGIATPIASAEIGIMNQELKESGAVKVLNIGEDANMQKMEDVLLNKMIDMCFVPFGANGGVNWGDLAKPSNDGKSYLDRATESLEREQTATRAENDKIRGENKDERRYAQDENKKLRAEEAGKTASTGKEINAPADPNNIPIPKNIAAATLKPEPAPVPPYKPVVQQQESMPMIKAMVSYQQKEIRHTGKYTAEAKSYFTTSLNERFGGNIGKINCASCIQKVNLDDPLYKQREIVAFLDGANADDFGKYINFVTVSMRKKHPGGDVTTDEVRVDRKNFNKEGNNFKMMYGWMKGDENRKSWLDYEYKTTWSFFGGGMIENDWKASNLPALNLSAPMQRRSINIMADGERLKEKDVRSVTVRLYYSMGGDTLVKQITLNPAKEVYNGVVEIVLPKNKMDYWYETEYLLNNNETKQTARKSSRSDDLYVDNL